MRSLTGPSYDSRVPRLVDLEGTHSRAPGIAADHRETTSAVARGGPRRGPFGLRAVEDGLRLVVDELDGDHHDPKRDAECGADACMVVCDGLKGLPDAIG
jgi:hypothetical protein